MEPSADPDYELLPLDRLGEVNQTQHRENARDQAVQKIQKIINEQFSFEIDLKEREVTTINQRIYECRSQLDRLRACILAGYYGYGRTPGFRQQVGTRRGKPEKPKAHLEPANINDIISWKQSLPSNLKQPDRCARNPPDQNQSIDAGSGYEKHLADQSLENNLSSFLPKCNTSICNVSRFYVKRRVIVGNTSKYILPEHRERNDRSTHKWMVYVRGPKEDGELQNFISKVWFLLHPSYQPNDLVEVCKPPFQVTRRGWGEFPVRVQLHFVGNKNKRVDIIHHLKLDKSYTGLQTLGAETHVDVELDRKNFNGLNSPPNLSLLDGNSKEPKTSYSFEASSAPVNSTSFNLDKSATRDIISNSEDIKLDQEEIAGDSNGRHLGHGILSDHSYSSIQGDDKSKCPDDVKYPTPPGSRCSTPKLRTSALPPPCKPMLEHESEALLQKSVQMFPLVTAEPSLNKPGYCASSFTQYFGWNVGKRLAAEWQRALSVKSHIESKVALSTKDVMTYCRYHGYTPTVNCFLDGKIICKFCGEENMHDDENSELRLEHEGCFLEFEKEMEDNMSSAREFLELLSTCDYPSATSIIERDSEDDVIDVVHVSPIMPTEKCLSSQPLYLPVSAELEWIKEIAGEIDVHLTNTDIDGVRTPVTSAMLYKASCLFIEELLRKANRFTWRSALTIPKAKCILPVHVKKAIEAIPYCDFLTDKYLTVELQNDKD